MAGTANDTDRAGLADAVREVEAASRAEVVVAVVSRSADYDRGPLLAGAAFGSAVLAFVLFSPWVFSLSAIAVLPPFAGAALALVVSAVPALERLVTPAGRRRKAVERAARAAFYDHRVSHTRERSGLLVYLSQLEREAMVVPDRGVTDCVPPDAWAAVVALVDAAGRTGHPAALAEAVRGMKDVLGREMPRRVDDRNELADVVEARA